MAKIMARVKLASKIMPKISKVKGCSLCLGLIKSTPSEKQEKMQLGAHVQIDLDAI